MNRATFGRWGAPTSSASARPDRIIGSPSGKCLCPAKGCECRKRAATGLFVLNLAGTKVAVCQECHDECEMTWEEVIRRVSG